MTFRELPEAEPNTTLAGGATLIAKQPLLCCRSCGATGSADPRDYWSADPSAEIECSECELPYVLVWPLHTVVPYEARHEAERFVADIWQAADVEEK